MSTLFNSYKECPEDIKKSVAFLYWLDFHTIWERARSIGLLGGGRVKGVMSPKFSNLQFNLIYTVISDFRFHYQIPGWLFKLDLWPSDAFQDW